MFGKRKPPQKPAAAQQAPSKPVERPMAPPMEAPAPETQVSAGRRDSQEAAASGSEGRKLVVGREICLTGEIKACEKLVVEGRVEADLTDSQFLEITEHGFFKGNAVVKNCEISGVFEGELVVHGYLHVDGGGRINGNVYYGELKVERGGRISGSMEQVDVEAQAAPGKPSLLDEAIGEARIPRSVATLHGDEEDEPETPDLAGSGTG